MTALPLVSVVIPCYGHAKWLPQGVSSCLEQTIREIEIIVVDDGSPDDVPGALAPFGDAVTLIQTKNQGLSSARNEGLAKANGTYVCFLDADDWLLPHALEMQTTVLTGLSEHVALMGHELHHEGNASANYTKAPPSTPLRQVLCFHNAGPVHGYLFPTSMVRDTGGFCTEERVRGGHEDYDLVCRLAAKGVESVVVPRIGCVYRKYPNSMSENSASMNRTRLNVWQMYVQELLASACEPALLASILGGYVHLTQLGLLEYQAAHLFEALAGQIREDASRFRLPTASFISACLDLLQACLPEPRNGQQGEARDQVIRLVGLLRDVLPKASSNALSDTLPLDPSVEFLLRNCSDLGNQEKLQRIHRHPVLGRAVRWWRKFVNPRLDIDP